MEIKDFLPYTLVSEAGAKHFAQCIENTANIKGDLVECGIWKGGMGMVAKLTDPHKKLWLCDSFEGCPPPRHIKDYNDKHHLSRYLKVSLEEVVINLNSFGFLNNVFFLKGWFKDTLPRFNAKISVLRVDCDMYSSTKDVLENMYQHVSEGGYVIIDDYHVNNHPACKKAVDEFREQNNITQPLIHAVDEINYWVK